MGFWDALRGISPPRTPDLDQLFSLPGAAITLQVALGFTATGSGSVCYRAAEGAASTTVAATGSALVDLDGPAPTTTVDSYGYTWQTIRTDPPDVGGLVTGLHAINTTLEFNGFAAGLLCSVVGFTTSAGAPAYLVYLYKQGTFYPFVPTGVPADRTRDVLVERQMRDQLAGEVRIEPDTSRWLPLWDLPV